MNPASHVLQAVTEETLKKLDAGYLRDMKLQGVERINKVFLRQQDSLFPDVNAETGFRTDKEWVLDTEGVNLMGVSGAACSLVLLEGSKPGYICVIVKGLHAQSHVVTTPFSCCVPIFNRCRSADHCFYILHLSDDLGC